MNDIIKEIIKNLLSSIGVGFEEIEISFDETTKNNRFMIKTNEPHILIGKDGEVLISLNHLIKQIALSKSSEENPFKLFTIDVNGYKTKQESELKAKALMLAERARFFKSNIEMTPMNPYERMFIHSIFSETPDIETESAGIGKSRRITIKFISS